MSGGVTGRCVECGTVGRYANISPSSNGGNNNSDLEIKPMTISTPGDCSTQPAELLNYGRAVVIEPIHGRFNPITSQSQVLDLGKCLWENFITTMLWQGPGFLVGE